MCRFIAYRGAPLLLHDALYRPAHSIITQSYRALERSECMNADGFGFGWYDDSIRPEPGVFRSIRPAWSNRNLRELARMIRTTHFFAHVRGAYPGMEVSELNCHPFTSGRFMFMHNGVIPNFHAVRLRLRRVLSDEAYLNIRGSTDSEHLFNLFLDIWTSDGREPGLEPMKRAFFSTLSTVLDMFVEADVDGVANLNMAVTDGENILACRFNTGGEPPPSLYYSSGADYRANGGGYHMVRPESGPGSVFIASERFSGDETWQCVPPNHLIAVESDFTVTLEGL